MDVTIAGIGLPLGRRGWAATAQLLGIGMATLDIAIANTALPTIAADLHTNAGSAIWIINAYQIVLIATALPLAALGDIVGHKRVFLYGMVLFTVASLACACSFSLTTLTMARVFQGLGGSAIMSVNGALIRFIYPERELGRGMGLNVLVVAVAFAIGPTAASAILSVGHWPLLFAINIPLGIAGFAIGMLMLPNTPRATYRFDIALAVLTAGAFGFLGLGLSGAAHADSLKISGAEILVGLIFAAMMLRRQASHPAPMLPVDLFKIPVFALSTVTAICSFATQGLAFVALPFYLEQILGRSQIETGFLITPWPIAVALTATLAGRLLDRYPAGVLGGVGLITLSLGMISLAVLPAHPSTLNIVWRMAVCGAGFGFFQSPNLKILMASAPANRAGGASGVVTLARLTGQTTGAAMVALCFSLAGRHGSILGLGLGAAFAAVAALASVFRLLVPVKQAEA